MAEKVNVLHLSDLHFGMEPTEKIPSTAVDQRNLTLEGLISTLRNLDDKWRPHLVAVSGDIGWKGIKQDYQKALKWFRDLLLPAIKLEPYYVVICPGNHDIDRTKTIGMSPPGTVREADEWLKMENIENFLRPFEMFSSFCEDMGVPTLAIGEQTGYLTGTVDIKDIRFVILNSAWFCRRDSDRDKLWIGKPLLEKMEANKQLVRSDIYNEKKSPITIAIFHHPHEWLNENEYNTFGDRQNSLKYLTERSHIILNGHSHARPSEPYRRFGPTWMISGGASYAEHLYRNHFSILGIDTETRVFERLCYEFDPGQNKWIKYNGDKKLPIYDLKETAVVATAPHLIIPGKYKQWIKDQCKDMDITKLAGSSTVIHVRLPEIYIPLFTNPIDKRDKKKEKQEPVDIEDLIARGRTLIIEGRAGSGKTTLAKHSTHMMIQSQEWEGLGGCLPVLVFLKDLKGFPAAGLKANSETAEKLLEYWSKATDSFLDVETIRSFCEAGKAVFFLDGLDEIDESLRELVVKSFQGIKIKYEKCKIILSGRPHGVDDTAKKWFGDRHVEILPLLMPQVEEFIHKWFQFVYESEGYGVKKTARDMIGEIRAHASINELIDSPLMLTAICLLYNDNKELPGQRAELYDRFVTNLLHKRFPKEAQKVRNFLIDLARQVHEKREKNICQLEAANILGNEYKKTKEESEKEYKDRIDAKFKEVEPNCGLLKFEKGGYAFIHLTFQEFLTACALVSGETESYYNSIQKYWDDSWYREIVQLYIGYLSIQNQAMANAIIQKILAKKERKPFPRHFLAVRSLIDIHKDNRNDTVIQTAVARLWEIIESDANPPVRAEAGELLGRIGDERDLEIFIKIPDGKYDTSRGSVELKSFEMAKYPVTNRWFRKFVQAEGYKKPEFWGKEGKKWLENVKPDYPIYWYDHKWNCDNHPVVGVSWYEADAFCRWLTQANGQKYTYCLPTEQEWEATAAGKPGRTYPWGKGLDEQKCNTSESKIRMTSAVGIFKGGDTMDGCSDMAGNVWEWTSSPWADDSPNKALRGGCWNDSQDNTRCSDRGLYLPIDRYINVGFRCSRTKN
jgi:hypothetical protein